MTQVLLQKEVRTKRIVALDQSCARALSDRIRARILEMLSHKPMTAEELTKLLDSNGQKKAVTTVRHHLDCLRTAGLIEATRMVEVRGALKKYYSPTVRAFSYAVPAGLDQNHAKLVRQASTKVLGILRTIHSDKDFLSAFAKCSPPCSMCKSNHLREYAAIEIINHAIAALMESREYAEMMLVEKETKGGATKS